MADTSIGLSKEAWRKLNRLKGPGDTFDDVIKALFNFEYQEDGPHKALKTPFGWIYFTSISLDGKTLILQKDSDVGRPLMPTGELNMNKLWHEVDAIIDNTPVHDDLPEGVKFGIIADTVEVTFDGADIEYELRFEVEKIEEKQVVVKDLSQNKSHKLVVGDGIVGSMLHVLHRIAIWKEGDQTFKRAVFEQHYIERKSPDKN